MEKYILISIITIVLSSCTNNLSVNKVNKTEKVEKYSTQFIKSEENIAIKGIEFGISKSEFNNKIKEISKSWTRFDNKKNDIRKGNYDLNGLIIDNIYGKFYEDKLYEIEIKGGDYNAKKSIELALKNQRDRAKEAFEDIRGKKITDEYYDKLSHNNKFQQDALKTKLKYHIVDWEFILIKNTLEKYGEPDSIIYKKPEQDLYFPATIFYADKTLAYWLIGNKTIEANLNGDMDGIIYFSINIYLSDIYNRLEQQNNSNKEQQYMKQQKRNELF